MTYQPSNQVIRIKFCGLTNAADVLAAADSGADAVGFVFVSQSRRYLTTEQAVELVNLAKKHDLLTVALFANQSAEEVCEVVARIEPDVLQFHGDESVIFCEQFDRPYWKAIPMLSTNDWLAYAKQYASADAWLLDSFGGSQIGGSGTKFVWFEVPSIYRNKVILAGGIDASNVCQAIAETGVTFIDTSSGIESSPGVKSKEKMQAMVTQIRSVSREPE